ncbi:Uncharacterized protein dnl_47410 [Desulfonema limicola]|uniref:Uncharacterized protein n=1 Tax=Desulfonema limicola TaxID=45656 RepID=A0A975GI75_9BACT|nr:Uncharacterized protein dnl_47410 [Desulfonema limicola]
MSAIRGWSAVSIIGRWHLATSSHVVVTVNTFKKTSSV